MSARTAVGLDIGTSAVRVAEVNLAKSPPVLERFGQVALPLGAVRAGEVVDVAAVTHAIRQLWQNVRPSSKKVVLGVANQRVVVRQVDLPWMALSELRQSLPFHVQDFIPMPVEDALLDFHLLDEVVDDRGQRTLRVLLVAAARATVDSALGAASGAGLKVTGVDLTPFAILRALGGPVGLGLDIGVDALVDVGASVTNIVVHANGVPKFVRILLMGGDDVTDAVAERVGIPTEQAEALKVEMGVPPQPSAPGAHPAARVIGATVGQLVDEVRGSLDYYLAQPHAERVDRVVLSGGGAQLAGFARLLSAATRLPVEPGEPLATLRLGKLGLSAEQIDHVRPLATVSVGLAMGAA